MLLRTTQATNRLLLPVLLGLLAVVASLQPSLATGDEQGKLESDIVRGPSLAGLTALAVRTNPSIRAAREAWRGAMEKYRVETGLPDPQLTGTYWTVRVPDDWGLSKFEAMLSQALPWPGKLDAAGRVVEAQARRARLDLDRTARDVSVRVRQSFHELWYIREAGRIARENHDLLDNLRKAGEAAYTGSKAALADVLRAQSQTAQVEYDILLLSDLEKAEIIRLNSLLDRPADAPVGPLQDEPPRPVTVTLEHVLQSAGVNRPEVLVAGAEEDMARADTRMARYENLPEFMVGLSYEYDAPMDQVTTKNMLGLQVGISLPLWPGKRAGRAAVAAAAVAKAQAETAAMVNETRAMVGETWFRLQNAWRLVTLYHDQLLPQAARAVELAQVRNREGEGSFSDYVETQATWYNFQLALARARADYGKYLASLEGLAGQSLTAAAVKP